MKKFFMLIITVAVIGGGGIFVLAHKDIKAPEHKVERVLSNEQFLK
jgi:hypothetical protein